MAQIFLSYSHRDEAFARSVVDGLSAEGYSLWWDRVLKSGEDFSMQAEKELDASKCVVVVWTSTSRNSLWVRAEANAALEGAKLIQVLGEPTKPPLPFTMLHFLDLTRWRGDRRSEDWRALSHSCHSLLAGEKPVDQAPAVRSSAPSLFGPMVAIGAGSIGLVAISATLAGLMASASSGAATLGPVTVGFFAAAVLGLGYMLMRTVQIGLASRRHA
ncbi:MAG TPA: toll/interleukin-1 receptor domain-containing protein [Hyphomonadaceae bacterium]|nr:toll/interleukin-1 receptor domain-containing protein [Hyphomonadaceae bacterium]